MPFFSTRMMWRPVVRPVTVTAPVSESTATPSVVKPLNVSLSLTVERATLTVVPLSGVKV